MRAAQPACFAHEKLITELVYYSTVFCNRRGYMSAIIHTAVLSAIGLRNRTPCLRPARFPEAMPHDSRGFTMVELVTVMVIAGVLALMVAPRFSDRNAFESRGFYDQVLSTLRYAQKAAIAQNRFVCAAFSATRISLTYGTTSACADGSLTSQNGAAPYAVTAPNSDITLSGYTPPFFFDALGRPSAAQSIAVSGHAARITVEAETGYVH